MVFQIDVQDSRLFGKRRFALLWPRELQKKKVYAVRDITDLRRESEGEGEH